MQKNSNNGKKGVVVIDAGIATEENLAMLRAEGYEYVCVSLSKPFGDFKRREEGDGVELSDRKGNKIFAQWIQVKDK